LDRHNSDTYLLRILFFVGFVVTGVVTTALGPILPIYISWWSLSDAQAGFFFTTQFVGSMVGVGLSSLLLSSRGYRTTLVLGYGLMGAGFVSILLGSEHLALAATSVYGAGLGLVIPPTNLWVAENAGIRSSSALSLLNLSWSAGSLVCPPLILWGVRTGHLETLLFGIAAAAWLLGLSALLVTGDAASTEFTKRNAQAVPETKSILGVFALGLLFFLYVGTENGVSGWAAAYSKRLDGSGMNAWELAPMFFWSGLLAGRLLAPLVLSRAKENRLVMSGLVAAGGGVTTLILTNTRMTALIGIAIVGLGLSIVYPIFISWLSQRYRVRARHIAGAMFAFGGLGGATIPWLVGALSTRCGNLRVGLLVPLAGCAIMLGTVTVFWHSASAHNPSP
jgi:MFS transporter, FHS family, glucose/mannose:H+ symporter